MNQRVQGRVTVKKKFGPMATMTSTSPARMIFSRISCSEARASAAEFAMTNPARPFLFSAEWKCWIQR